MQIGSAHPLRADAGMAEVTPAAWVYAWSQSRHMLPGWYGAGTGLEFARNERGLPLLRTCYRGWPFFRTLIDDIEAMLARSTSPIVAHYDRLVSPELRTFSALLRAEYDRSSREILQIKESDRLLDTDSTLQRAIGCATPTSIRCTSCR